MNESEKLAIQSSSHGKAFHVQFFLCCGPLLVVLLFPCLPLTRFSDSVLAAFELVVAAVSQNFILLV